MNRIRICVASLLAGVLGCLSLAEGASIPSIRGSVYSMMDDTLLIDVPVELYADDGNGVFESTDALIDTVMTDSDGRYGFDDLEPALGYFVKHRGYVSELQSLGSIAYLVDDFAISQTVVANALSIARFGSVTAPEEHILGGSRDMYLQIHGGVAEGQLRANPYAIQSSLQIDMSAGVTGLAVITWGSTGDTIAVTPREALAMDFTQDGMYEGIALELAVDAAGAGQLLDLVIHSPGGRISSAKIEIPVEDHVLPGVPKYVPFDAFQGNADVKDVSALQLIVDATLPSLDARIDRVTLHAPNDVNFAVVPEPHAPQLLGFLLLAFGMRRSRSPSCSALER